MMNDNNYNNDPVMKERILGLIAEYADFLRSTMKRVMAENNVTFENCTDKAASMLMDKYDPIVKAGPAIDFESDDVHEYDDGRFYVWDTSDIAVCAIVTVYDELRRDHDMETAYRPVEPLADAVFSKYNLFGVDDWFHDTVDCHEEEPDPLYERLSRPLDYQNCLRWEPAPEEPEAPEDDEENEDEENELGELIGAIQSDAMRSLGMTGVPYGDDEEMAKFESAIDTAMKERFPMDLDKDTLHDALDYADFWNSHAGVASVCRLYKIEY
ncbi:hypothetical protein EMO89_00180 [Bifidobacterium tissieri]|uniref:Uncharacterized protein n=1 Tax=Bifidobacterium tissieri TaxID=1630162 RepID=A0A5M9ZWG7_9BIFI|nr:hypothetical protein [Bifidobacterium tissieri]KAA8831981.1 hypothetical protein EMO89_00180 [Bifidobacterium tissieri]